MAMKHISRGLLDAAGTAAYVAAVAWFGTHAQNFLGKPNGILAPMFMLLLFVISALITGLLVLGKPVMLYANGSKREALSLVLATLGWLIVFLAGTLVFMLPR